MYKTRRSNTEGEVLMFYSFFFHQYMSTRQFGFTFFDETPKVWNKKGDNICHFSFLIQKEAENLTLCKSIPTLGLFVHVSVLCGG